MPNLSVQLEIISLLAELVVGGAVAAPAPIAWTVSPDFKKGEDARKNLKRRGVFAEVQLQLLPGRE